MTPDIPIPNEACCLGCGYLLRGLPEPVCPECGRAFDPADVTTFGIVDPRKRRRRRMIWIGSGVLLVILSVVLGPRGVMTSSVTLTCPDCGVTYRTARYELSPPSWIPWRYPGMYWPLVEQTEETHDGCPDHRYNVSVAVQSRAVLRGSGTASPKVGQVGGVNGYRATPEQSRAIIESMIKMSGVSLRCDPAPDDGSGP